MRAFVRLREILATHKDLARKLEKLELRVDAVVNVLQDFMKPPDKPTRRIGFGKGKPSKA